MGNLTWYGKGFWYSWSLDTNW